MRTESRTTKLGCTHVAATLAAERGGGALEIIGPSAAVVRCVVVSRRDLRTVVCLPLGGGSGVPFSEAAAAFPFTIRHLEVWALIAFEFSTHSIRGHTSRKDVHVFREGPSPADSEGADPEATRSPRFVSNLQPPEKHRKQFPQSPTNTPFQLEATNIP